MNNEKCFQTLGLDYEQSNRRANVLKTDIRVNCLQGAEGAQQEGVRGYQQLWEVYRVINLPMHDTKCHIHKLSIIQTVDFKKNMVTFWRILLFTFLLRARHRNRYPSGLYDKHKASAD